MECLLPFILCRHQGQSDESIRTSEEEFDRQSKRNVERWVSAHIVPVSTICHFSSSLYIFRQESPIVLESHYRTLLKSKYISFTPIAENDGKEQEWSHVTVEDGIHIIGMKQVRIASKLFNLHRILIPPLLPCRVWMVSCIYSTEQSRLIDLYSYCYLSRSTVSLQGSCNITWVSFLHLTFLLFDA